MPDIAISSVSIRKNNIENLCLYAIQNGITSIELSGNLEYIQEKNLRKIIYNYKNEINFYIHNYFPPPKKEFVLNLAHPETVERSIKFCIKTVNLCADLGIKQYSIHAGMAFNPNPSDLGNQQLHLTPLKIAESRKILIDASLRVAEYAKERLVKILFENNVIAQFNCNNGINDRYHFADIYESEQLKMLFKHPNIGVLVDVGHLKVSSHTMGFNSQQFLNSYKNKIYAVHLSDNDGMADQNMPITEDSWFWSYIPWVKLHYISLEINNQPIEILKDQINIVKKKIKSIGN